MTFKTQSRVTPGVPGGSSAGATARSKKGCWISNSRNVSRAATGAVVGRYPDRALTLLNALSGYLPTTAPVAALETFRELEIQHPFLLRAVAPAELPPGTPGVTLDWVLNVIYTRMNPAAILVGEVVAVSYTHLRAHETRHDLV